MCRFTCSTGPACWKNNQPEKRILTQKASAFAGAFFIRDYNQLDLSKKNKKDPKIRNKSVLLVEVCKAISPGSTPHICPTTSPRMEGAWWRQRRHGSKANPRTAGKGDQKPTIALQMWIFHNECPIEKQAQFSSFFLRGKASEARMLSDKIPTMISSECVFVKPTSCSQLCASIFTPMKVSNKARPYCR